MKNSYIALGYNCNHKCISCPLTNRDRRQKALSSDVLNELLNSFGNGDHITVSGGEPTLHDNLLYVIDLCKQRGISLTLLTNSTGFSNAEYAREISKRCNHRNFDLVTAIYHSNPVLHDYITGLKGSFDTSIKAIGNILSEGLILTIKIIISKFNYDDILNIVKFLYGKFGNRIIIQFTSMDYSGEIFNNPDNFFIGFKEYYSKLEECMDFLIKNNIRFSLIEMPFCYLDPYYWRFFPKKNNGLDVYAAPNVSEENKTLANIKNDCHTNYSVCQKCLAKNICHGAWESAIRLGGEKLLNPILK